MRKTRVLLFLFVLVGTGLFAQSENKTTTLAGNEALLQNISTLKEQSQKVNVAYEQLLASSTGSRSSAAFAVTVLNDACNGYLAELNKESLNTADEKVREAVSREIVLVKKIQSDYCTTGK